MNARTIEVHASVDSSFNKVCSWLHDS